MFKTLSRFSLTAIIFSFAICLSVHNSNALVITQQMVSSGYYCVTTNINEPIIVQANNFSLYLQVDSLTNSSFHGILLSNITGVCIHGCPPSGGRTKVKATQPNCVGIYLYDHCSNIQIYDIFAEGYTWGIAVDIECQYICLNSCKGKATESAAFYINQSTYVHLTDCLVDSSGNHGFWANYGAFHKFKNCTATHVGDYGFVLYQSTVDSIDNCTSNNNVDGFAFYWCTGWILNCIANNNSTWGYIDYEPEGSTIHNAARANTASGNGGGSDNENYHWVWKF